MKNKSFEDRVKVSSLDNSAMIFESLLSKDEVVGVAIYNNAKSVDKFSIADSKSFDNSSFHFIAPRKPMAGMNGYQVLVGMLDSLNAAIKYTYVNNKDSAIKAKINMLNDEPVLSHKLFSDMMDKEWFLAKSEQIEAADVIEVAKTNTGKDKSIESESLEFGIKCWEGSCNFGEPGFIRVLAMKSAIERTLASINLQYPSYHLESTRINKQFSKPKGSESEMTL